MTSFWLSDGTQSGFAFNNPAMPLEPVTPVDRPPDPGPLARMRAEFERDRSTWHSIAPTINRNLARDERKELILEYSGKQSVDEALEPYRTFDDGEEMAIKRFRETLADERRSKIFVGPEMEERAKEIALERVSRAEDARRRSSSSLTSLGGLAGNIGAGVTDPINLAATLLGAPWALSVARGAIGRSLATRVFRGAGVEAAINMGAESAIQPFVQDYRKELGLPYGFDEALTAITFAGILGGAFGGAGVAGKHLIARGRGLVTADGIEVPAKLADYIRRPEDGKPLSELTLRETLDEFDQRVPDPTPAERDARNLLEGEAFMQETNAYSRDPKGQQKHARAVADAERQIVTGDVRDPYATPEGGDTRADVIRSAETELANRLRPPRTTVTTTARPEGRDRLDIRETGSATRLARVDVAPGERVVTLEGLEVADAARRPEINRAVADAIARKYPDRRVVPGGALSDDAFEFFRQRDPFAVKDDLRMFAPAVREFVRLRYGPDASVQFRPSGKVARVFDQTGARVATLRRVQLVEAGVVPPIDETADAVRAMVRPDDGARGFDVDRPPYDPDLPGKPEPSAFAVEVQGIAREVATGSKGFRQAWISDVYARFAKGREDAPDIAAFKAELAESHRRGEIELAPLGRVTRETMDRIQPSAVFADGQLMHRVKITGARGSALQDRQISGMRGTLIAEYPERSAPTASFDRPGIEGTQQQLEYEIADLEQAVQRADFDFIEGDTPDAPVTRGSEVLTDVQRTMNSIDALEACKG